ncbi:IS2 transposase TnpB [Planctomyces sp. SH-PL62]|nr:IS2 transposase TnpB [Planctomyces sp. SH-PL62]
MADLAVRYGVGVRRPCEATEFPRATHNYKPRHESQEASRMRLRKLATDRVRYGYRRLHVLLLREGWAVDVKRVHRLYGLERLTLRRKSPRRRVSSRHRDDRPAVEAADQAWAMDFMSDALADGRKLRVLTVIDLFTRESLAIRVGVRFTSGRVAEVLAEVARGRGAPSELRVDNGPEFTGKMLDLWAYLNGVPLDFSRPGKPTDDGFIESFNGRVGEECLDQGYFTDLEDAREKVEAWRIDYNEVRPHSALGYLPPRSSPQPRPGRRPPRPTEKLSFSRSNFPGQVSLYEAFPPEQARRIAERLEIHHTPKHGAWLNVAEIELSVLSRQCLDRRIGSMDELEREVAAWEEERNERRVETRWRFTTADARIKLHRI